MWSVSCLTVSYILDILSHLGRLRPHLDTKSDFRTGKQKHYPPKPMTSITYITIELTAGTIFVGFVLTHQQAIC
jgi:hypothetical protein